MSPAVAVDRSTVLVNLMWLVPGCGGRQRGVGHRRAARGRPIRSGRPRPPPGGADVRSPERIPTWPTRSRRTCPAWTAPTRPAGCSPSRPGSRRWPGGVGADVVHHAGGTVPLRAPRRGGAHDPGPAAARHAAELLDGEAHLPAGDARPLRPGRRRGVRSERVHPLARGRAARCGRIRGAGRAVGAAPGAGCRSPAPRRSASVPDGPFLLYPAITYPHKNHLVLLDAFARLQGPAAAATLVLTGGSASTEARRAVPDRPARTGRPGAAAPARVDQDHLEALYAAAAGVVVPSRYEGFGLPALEAMERGCPVVVARCRLAAGGGADRGPGRSRRCDSVGDRHAGCPHAVGPGTCGPDRGRTRPVPPDSPRSGPPPACSRPTGRPDGGTRPTP